MGNIRRYIRDDKREPAPAKKPKQNSRRIPVRVSRNFANYPLARNVRCKVRWRIFEKTGRYWARLPYEDRIRAIYPADTPESRLWLPGALEVNLLFRLLGEARKAKSREIAFASAATLLRDCGLSERHSDNLHQINRALDLWSRMSLRYENCWYAGKGKTAERHTLPPPIRKLDRTGYRIRLTLDRDWFDMATARGYNVLAPLPLPSEPTVQNAALMVLNYRLEITDYKHSGQQIHARGPFAGKSGIGGKNRKRRLAATMAEVVSWFEKSNGALAVEYRPRWMDCVVVLPEYPFSENSDLELRRPRSHECDVDVATLPPNCDVHVVTTEENNRRSLNSSRDAAGSRFARGTKAAKVEPALKYEWEDDDDESSTEVHPDPYADR